MGGPKIRFYAGAPLVTPRGEALGTLCVFDRVPRALAPEQLAALQALARTVMELLDKRLMLRALGSALVALSHEQREIDATRATTRHVLRQIASVAAAQPATLARVGERVGQEIEGRTTAERLAAYERLALGKLREGDRLATGLRAFEGRGLMEVRAGERRSTCLFTAGFLRGVVGAEAGSAMVSEEVACESRGDSCCRFVRRAAKAPLAAPAR